MPRNTVDGCELVVVELGAAWPASLIVTTGGCRVIAETEGEGPLGFAARVDDFVVQAFPRGVPVVRAVVACNLRADQTAEAARRAVAESLLGRLGGKGSLFFTASHAAGDRFRRRLLDLVAELASTGARADRIHALLGDDEGRASGPRTSEGAPALGVDAKVARVA
jgi:hypothetical protein